MTYVQRARVRFGNKDFEYIGDETTSAEVFTLREARVYGETGQRIATSE